MRFRYRAFSVEGVGSRHMEMIWRPVVSIRVFGPNANQLLSGLIDTGADDTLLPDSLIKLLGVVSHPEDVAVIRGIDGSPIVVSYATVDLQLSSLDQPSERYRWSARVGFHPRHNVVLGHSGFLNHIIALFNGRTREVILKPYDLGMNPPIL